MILNALEFALMNNPVRACIQRYVEAPMLKRLGGDVPGALALEVGCGRGVGAAIILKSFGAARVDAFDLDPRMIARAQHRLRDRPVRAFVGDVTNIAAADATYDAAFDFGIIHHVPDWRKALREISRVLKPGGRFYAEEVLRDFINPRLCRALFAHPWEDRFDHGQFVAGLSEAGLAVVSSRQIWNRAGWYVAQKKAAAGAS